MPKASLAAHHAVEESATGKRKAMHTETNNASTTSAEISADQNVNALIGTVQNLLPEELVCREDLSVRLWEGDGKKEQERIIELARSIREEGQLQDGAAFPVQDAIGEIEYNLFMGNRRRNAIALINAELPAGAEPMRMRVRIWSQEDMKQLRRKAIHENMKRQNFSAMDFALLIAAVRKENGWDGGKQTKNVAAYFGVSPAQITQHEKILTLPLEVQAKAGELSMSADTLQTLATEVKPEAAAIVTAKAEEIATAEAAKKGKKGAGTTKPVTTKSGKADAKADAKADSKPETTTKPKVEKKHVEKAARELDALNVAKPRSKGELLAHLQEIADSPAYGYENSPVRAWALYFLESFATGKAKTDRGLYEKFDAMVMNDDGLFAGEGTPSKSEQKALDEEEARAAEKAKAKAATAEKGKAKGKAKTA